ncbi:LysR family transcriptional regulator [Rhizobium pusense]|uniref:LysR family transcriptional regulator n=1 Tax=Agrobacterium pusense TaxID=648995 RepID=UPI00244ADF6E|nr:LysR family transcriptional regulator [Agrobacterium pusense]MDH1270472.1 LysR family transcriptional regulator [Agrobacterium pusense]
MYQAILNCLLDTPRRACSDVSLSNIINLSGYFTLQIEDGLRENHTSFLWPAEANGIGLRHLKYMVAAVEYGSFRKAGVALNVGESAISRRICDLEDRIGASLFVRHSGGVRPTTAGLRFLKRAQAALRNIAEASREVGAIGRGDNGKVKIGISSSILSGFLPHVIGVFESRHAAVDIDLTECNFRNQLVAVQQGQLDVAFGWSKTECGKLCTTPLWSERLFAVLPSDHVLASQLEVRWPELLRETFIVSDRLHDGEVYCHLLKRTAEFGGLPKTKFCDVARDNLIALVSLRRGLALLSESAVSTQIPGVIYRPISDDVLTFHAVWSAENINPAFRRFLSLALTLAASK